MSHVCWHKRQLPTEKERGDAFEVFVEAYLSIDEVAQADEAWVVGKVPSELRRKLNLPASDYGYDGVFRTRLGELVPYQAKFRTGRTPLPYRELSTFFGITEKAERRVVLTNAVGIAEVAKSRTNFNATRGTDFDRLDAARLGAIAAWIEGIKPLPQVREARPHQRAALVDIERELAAHDRATVVMACGTGKTLLALWAAEKAVPKSVLVLVPSLNLLRQTLHEWAKWTNWRERFRYLCVCSDPKVTKGIDEIEIRPEDTDFPVRTDPAIVGRFLDEGDDAVSVVFCTYQSAPVVGEATNGREPFDLGIFDEAHKTTGRERTFYAFALKDANLPIRKRLFLTATPRHYDISKRDNEGDFAVASMDDEAIYGRVAHRLSFAQAASQKIIVPYKVVISVVDSEMIDNALLDQSEVVIKGDPVRAKWVAHQIALRRAVEEHDLKRLITFHSSINAAAAFASDKVEGVGIHLPNFQRFHVSGIQPTAERDEHMREFARVQRGIITNARCLTEGVDVPSVDMVAFMNPRRSKVDIVQAVGRAMRIAGEEKTCGYVLIPLFLETRQGETLSEALERSDFYEIAQVLNAMRDNDDELGDIIQALSVEGGQTGRFDDSRLHDKVEVLGPQIQLSELATSIRVRLVEELGVTWDERYGQLIAYRQLHGDCHVLRDWSVNPGLEPWCGAQRTLYNKGKLSPDRITRLEQIGFEWDLFAAAWEEMFATLKAYKQTYGDCNVPQNWKEDPKLSLWCTSQRRAYRNNTLSPERVQRLEQLGLVWDMHELAWDKMFAALSDYRQKHGDCNVPQTWKDDPSLAIWCRVQRSLYKDNELSLVRIKRLEQIGFVWSVFAAAWEEMFAALTAYKQTHGDCNVPAGWKENPRLSNWCMSQRAACKNNTLSPERVQRLEQLGFRIALNAPRKRGWGDLKWGDMFLVLVAYKQTHSDCNVPAGWKENSKLASWLADQREAYRNNRLFRYRVDALEQLGVVWNQEDVVWQEMFAALAAYKQTHGDCYVPARWKEHVKLAEWCARQRKAYRNNKLPVDRVQRLEQLGFVGNRNEIVWQEMFAALAAYKEAHGECNVPQKWRDNPRLGNWCTTQRTAYRLNNLSSDRLQRLKELGFRFDMRKLKEN